MRASSLISSQTRQGLLVLGVGLGLQAELLVAVADVRQGAGRLELRLDAQLLVGDLRLRDAHAAEVAFHGTGLGHDAGRAPSPDVPLVEVDHVDELSPGSACSMSSPATGCVGFDQLGHGAEHAGVDRAVVGRLLVRSSPAAGFGRGGRVFVALRLCGQSGRSSLHGHFGEHDFDAVDLLEAIDLRLLRGVQRVAVVSGGRLRSCSGCRGGGFGFELLGRSSRDRRPPRL